MTWRDLRDLLVFVILLGTLILVGLDFAGVSDIGLGPR